jgi:hypothetical protein
MALQPGSFFESDTTGSNETISLQPVSPATSTNAGFASAFYGTDSSGTPQPVTIAPGGQSLSFTVLNGINPLVITLVSPNPSETVQLTQGSTLLEHVVLSQHSAVTTLFIKGT